MIVSKRKNVEGKELLPNSSISSTGVIIGFVEDSVKVNEPSMLASLTVQIFSGFLEPGTTSAFLVGFSTTDASAHCKC